MEIRDYIEITIVFLLLQCLLLHGLDGCKCTGEVDLKSCHCEGVNKITDKHFPDGTLHKLSLENGNFTYFLHNTFKNYKKELVELTITRSQFLREIDHEVLQGMPHLDSLRITHTSLERVPQVSDLGVTSTMRIIDFESNKIMKVPSNALKVRVAHLSLDYNFITSIDDWAFNGSEIEKLSIKGNIYLTFLSKDSFSGMRSLRDLDLSETSITYLPTSGLEDLEILRLKNTYTLKIIPSVYDLRKLQLAHLTYSFHCCAFHHPEKHDPTRHKEYINMRKKFCAADHERTERDMYDESTFMGIVNGTIVDHLPIISSNGGFDDSMQYEGFTEETFHPTTVDTKNSSVFAVCGNLTGKFVTCFPVADALNPCEDMMGWDWLRVSVWFVLTTAFIGNVTVLVVLCLSRSERSVPRYLMCNLAFADVLMAAFLLMLAIMDLISTGNYFNWAYDWQRGFGCKVAGFLTVFASQLSLFTLSLLTMERWFAIRHALYLNMLDLRLTSNIMMIGWAYSILVAALPLFGVSSYSSTSICIPMEAGDPVSMSYIIAMVLVAGSSFVLMCVCYIQIYMSLSEDTRHSVGEGSVARKMTILVFTNFICWAPVAFFTLTAVAGHPLITVSQSKILLVFIYPINSCANPYLYAILTKQFRKDFMVLVSRYIKCRDSYRYKNGYVRPPSYDTTRTPMTTMNESVV